MLLRLMTFCNIRLPCYEFSASVYKTHAKHIRLHTLSVWIVLRYILIKQLTTVLTQRQVARRLFQMKTRIFHSTAANAQSVAKCDTAYDEKCRIPVCWTISMAVYVRLVTPIDLYNQQLVLAKERWRTFACVCAHSLLVTLVTTYTIYSRLSTLAQARRVYSRLFVCMRSRLIAFHDVP